jgi:phosphotransferase system enzyme I (PtsI)
MSVFMPSQNETKREIKIQGVAAAPGVARGPAFIFLQKGPSVPCRTIADENIEDEAHRFEGVLVATRTEISALRSDVARRLGENEAAIFDAHLLVLDDPAIVGETLQMLRSQRLNVEHCFQTVSERYIQVFSKLEDPYFRERAVDIRDVARRVLANLLGLSRKSLSEIAGKRVIVADDLTPSDTAALDTAHAVAFVTNAGNRTSHAVIMSRSLRIPAVVGLMVATDKILLDDDVLVDGYEGLVFVNPSEETLWRYGEIKNARDAFRRRVDDEADLPEKTSDGLSFKLSANVNGAEDVPAMNRVHAGGVGLFRTESVFLKTPGHVPGEEEQFAHYKALLEAVAPDRVIVRTLDIGGDKPHNALFTGSTVEDNPFMGFRAIRICLERKDIFRDQLRAILRASAFGRAKILFPMIASVDELVQARALFEETKNDLRSCGIPFDEAVPLGAMIEIPSAAVCADLLAEHCEFFSIGTNDLVQYLLAVDRGNSRIAHLYEPCNPAVLRVLRDVIRTAKEKKINVGVCGELAGDITFAPLLFALGADSLSMTPAAIPEVRYLLRHTARHELDALVAAVFAESDPGKIQQILRAFASARMK